MSDPLEKAVDRAAYSNLLGTNRLLTQKIADRDATIARLQAEVERLKSDRASAEPDWFWRDLDPDDSGDSVEEALRHMPQGVVCHIRSSYIGPSFFAATVPVLETDSDDQEHIRADTEEECLALVRARMKIRAFHTGEE